MQHVTHLSELVLDEWAAQELSTLESDRVAQHLATCEDCRERHEALERERHAFLAAAPSFHVHAARFVSSAGVRAGVRQAQAEPRPSSEGQLGPHRVRSAARQSALLVASSIAAMAAAAVLVVWVAGPAEQRTNIKGQPHIGWFVKRGNQVRRGQADEPVYPRDELRFVYSSDAPRYFALFNLDARSATVYFPPGANGARVRAGSDLALDFSVELDDQLGTERVWALFCDQSFEVEPLRAALHATRRLPEPPGCTAELVALQKVAPR
jgi:hypothetical protein